MDIRHREQVKEYVVKAGMTSVSNNSKWNRLFVLLQQSNRLFQYRRTDLDGSTFPEDGESYAPELAQYWGDFWAMEFLDVLAYQAHARGALLTPEIEDFTDEVIHIASQAGVKFTILELGIRVWGYVRKESHPVFACMHNKSLQAQRQDHSAN